MTERAGREVPSTRPTLVGREATVGHLAGLVDSGRGALVVGPPGVGVSALLVAVAGAQRAAGRPVQHEVAADDRGLALDVDGSGPDGPPPDGGARPLVVVDDAHRLAEADAVDLRRRLLAGQVRCVVGTTALDQVPPALDWLWQSGTLERVDLEPLSSDDLAAWVTALVGAAPRSADGRRTPTRQRGDPTTTAAPAAAAAVAAQPALTG